MKQNNTYILKTLGCKANLYDSQLIEAELQKRGWKPRQNDEAEAPGLCIVNSCTVTDEADRQSRRMASRLARENPSAKVVMTGCAAEVDPERMAASKGVHYVIGNRDKPELVALILKKLEQQEASPPSELGIVLGGAQGYREMLSRHPMDREWYLEEGFATPPVELQGEAGRSSKKTRAFLKIQEGCNAFCTYCVIPYGRGPSRSIKPGEVVRQIRELVAHGTQEVVITGTNIGDYGTDWSGAGLVELFKMIFSETELKRLRVSSLDPAEITPELLELMESEARFCPHFHVSLQSPHGRILKLMKRKYSAERVSECLTEISRVRRGGVFVGMDVITGFPGETEREFEEGLAALESLPWSRLHVFPYSERAGTPATRLPGTVRRELRTERARKLSALSLNRMRGLYERKLSDGKPVEGVLLEHAGDSTMAGYSPGYVRVHVPADPNLENRIVDVVPTGITLDEAAGEVALTGRVTAR